jgi:hypothetical protein
MPAGADPTVDHQFPQQRARAPERMKSEALLTGRILDDRGNRMTPSHARKVESSTDTIW